MKSKRLITAVSIILIFLVGSFIKESRASEGRIEAKKENKIPTVGILQFVSHPSLDQIRKGMIDEMADSGYKEGKTVNIDFQNGQADQSKLASMSQQLISKNPDVLVGIATPAAQALANQTKDIPLILGAVSDPVRAGLVKTLEKPKTNATGVSDIAPVDKQLDLVEKILPGKKVMGILTSSGEDNSKSYIERTTKIAEAKGFTVKSYTVPSSNEITQMVHSMAGQIDFLYIPNDNTIANAIDSVIAVTDQYKIPVIPSVDAMVKQGGLATIGSNQYKLGREVGKKVVGVLEGKINPADTSVEIFKEGDPSVNKEKAEELGITIPQDIINQANKAKDVN
ncbi:tryptophan ABC transporter substrate-binding protein [Vagococcus vulneris]|uniref:Peptide ABC transporter substrate-binding protein n=1 Tax=Vagococcus vulneris TaxID=1977869 RepID=A0A430A258_9ENTE|nr:tryptophan ABC transporter substrate-binding protein [Vagococcus vulneris]RSU00553.1 peptide ABC transporter substrate-binding protein [Vagococcus vulneris]